MGCIYEELNVPHRRQCLPGDGRTRLGDPPQPGGGDGRRWRGLVKQVFMSRILLERAAQLIRKVTGAEKRVGDTPGLPARIDFGCR